jgi:hypothetical protein
MSWSHPEKVSALNEVSLSEVKSVGLGDLLNDILRHGDAD